MQPHDLKTTVLKERRPLYSAGVILKRQKIIYDHAMHPVFVLGLMLALTALSGCSTVTRFADDNAAGYTQMEREECVPYARRVSGIAIRGNAHTWWDQAAGLYQRGNKPEKNAVLVLAQSPRLRHGHLAVVTDILDPRRINVTHTNWGSGPMSRRIVYERMLAEDISPANNWTYVRFWNKDHDNFGFPYIASGFIYNRKAH